MIFNLFFKSNGGKPTSGKSTNYYTNLGQLDINNMDELRDVVDKVADYTGQPVERFDIDVKGDSIPYKNVIKTTDNLEHYNINATQ